MIIALLFLKYLKYNVIIQIVNVPSNIKKTSFNWVDDLINLGRFLDLHKFLTDHVGDISVNITDLY